MGRGGGEAGEGIKCPGRYGAGAPREEAHLILEGQELLVVRDLLGERVRGIHLLQRKRQSHTLTTQHAEEQSADEERTEHVSAHLMRSVLS